MINVQNPKNRGATTGQYSTLTNDCNNITMEEVDNQNYAINVSAPTTLKLLDDNTGREKVKVKVKQQTQPQEKSAYLQVITYLRYHNRILE